MDILQQKQARTLFKLRTRMNNFRSNSKNKYEDVMCPRCKNEIDDEKDLFTKCEKLADIRVPINLRTTKKMTRKAIKGTSQAETFLHFAMQ